MDKRGSLIRWIVVIIILLTLISAIYYFVVLAADKIEDSGGPKIPDNQGVDSIDDASEKLGGNLQGELERAGGIGV